jgi:hypothetical protein
LRQQLLFIGENAGPTLRIDQIPGDGYLENAAARFDEGYLAVQFLLDFGRQTGGPLAITSLVTVFDTDIEAHDCLLHRCARYVPVSSARHHTMLAVA